MEPLHGDIYSSDEALWHHLILPLALLTAPLVALGFWSELETGHGRLGLLLFLVAAQAFFAWWWRRSLRQSSRRVTKGSAIITVDEHGFVFDRNGAQERYGWDQVDAVRQWAGVDVRINRENTVYVSVGDSLDVMIGDDAKWSRFEAMNRWSGGRIAQRLE